MICVSLTTNLARVAAPGNVLAPAWESGLPQDSVINVSQLITVDRQAFSRRMGSLPDDVLTAVEAGVRRVLGL